MNTERVREWDFFVPAKFFHDHTERCPCDEGEAGMVRFIRQQGPRVMVRGNAKQITNLYNDAKFYAEGNVDDCGPLVRSAAATVRGLEKRGIHKIA